MSEKNTYPFKRGQFYCEQCQKSFFAETLLVRFEDERFVADCPSCESDVPETVWMKNLHKTQGTAKGAAMSAEGRDKSRLNGFTTGSTLARNRHAGKIPMAPAKPGKYPECDACQDLDDCQSSVDEKRGTRISVYCHRKAEVSLKYAAAFLSGDPENMKLVAANNAAQMQMIFDASIKKIFERGVEVVEEALYKDKAGQLIKGRDGELSYVEKIYAHPLIKQCINIMQVMGFTLTDWTMTPKSKEAKEQLSGFLAGAAAASGKSAEDVANDIKETIGNFTNSLDKAKELRAGDTTLQEFKNEKGRRDGVSDPA